MVEERIYELEDISIAISKTKDKKQTEYPRIMGQL